jgi:hypothetical protein
MPSEKDDLEYVRFLKQLIEGKYLEDAALEVARQATEKGLSTLNNKQRDVLGFTLKQIAPGRCQSCGNTIPWPEMYQAISSHSCLACASG